MKGVIIKLDFIKIKNYSLGKKMSENKMTRC